MMSTIEMIFSWVLKCRKTLISLKILFASTISANVSFIFLIATFVPVSVSTADATRPYDPVDEVWFKL
jgi:hypothetical protein